MKRGVADEVHWFDAADHPHRNKHRKLCRWCKAKGCEREVKCEIAAGHGIPKCTSRVHLSHDEVQDILRQCAKKPTYCYATPLHKDSLIRRDLVTYYGSVEKVEAHLLTESGRLKLCSDIIHLRRTSGVSIRMSRERETDRFTTLQRDALLQHSKQASSHSDIEDLRVLYLNVYLSRTALSEWSRLAMQNHTFPFFPNDLFTLKEDVFLEQICHTFLKLLDATEHAPYARVLKPYSAWLQSRAIYLAGSDRGLSAVEDALMISCCLAGCSLTDLQSPAMMEALISDISYFGVFRSKEIWLDPAHIMLGDPERFNLSADASNRIASEILTVGDAGPGPRRLIRFVAGDPVHKAEFTKKEQTKYAELCDGMLVHFQERFQIRGTIQAYFQMCEASKGVSDLFCNTGIPYTPFAGYNQLLTDDATLDVDLNAPELVRKRFGMAASKFFQRYPKMYDQLRAKLPR